MPVPPPSWSQMLSRATVGFSTARGTIRHEIPAEDGRFARGSCRFWYAAPNRWRVEDDEGVRHLQGGEWFFVRDEEGRLQRLPLATTSWHFEAGHPWSLFGEPHDRLARFTDPNAFSVPMGPPSTVEIAGRRCWEFALAPPPRKPHPLRIAFDDVTATVLRWGVPELGFVEVAEEFEPDVAIDDSTFVWTGSFATTWWDERLSRRRERDWLEEQEFPVPRWWPRGFEYGPWQGDPGYRRVQRLAGRAG